MLKRIMVRAHQIAKGMEGDYQAKLALALRQAWKEERGNEEMSNTVKRFKANEFENPEEKPFVTIMEVFEKWTLPELEGTEKQIKWANSIRADFMRSADWKIRGKEEVHGITVEEFLSKLEAMINENTTAKFWIDNRNRI